MQVLSELSGLLCQIQLHKLFNQISRSIYLAYFTKIKSPATKLQGFMKYTSTNQLKQNRQVLSTSIQFGHDKLIMT